MSQFFAGLLLGLTVGASLGVVIACLLITAGEKS